MVTYETSYEYGYRIMLVNGHPISFTRFEIPDPPKQKKSRSGRDD